MPFEEIQISLAFLLPSTLMYLKLQTDWSLFIQKMLNTAQFSKRNLLSWGEVINILLLCLFQGIYCNSYASYHSFQEENNSQTINDGVVNWLLGSLDILRCDGVMVDEMAWGLTITAVTSLWHNCHSTDISWIYLFISLPQSYLNTHHGRASLCMIVWFPVIPVHLCSNKTAMS